MNNESEVIGGPGIPAFVAFLFLVIALWLLMRNMNGRLRRMSYQHKLDDEADHKGTATSGGSAAAGSTDQDQDEPDHGDGSDGGSDGRGGGGGAT